MTKILACGDFHGTFPKKLINIIKKEKIDLILCNGDLSGNKEYEKLFFSKVYGKQDEEIAEEVKKRLEFLDKKVNAAGLFVVKKLAKLKIPVYCVFGNWDPAPFGKDITMFHDLKGYKKDTKNFLRQQNDYFRFIDLNGLELEDFILVGGTSSTAPVSISKKAISKLLKKWKLSGKKAKKTSNDIIRGYLFRQKKYDAIFSQALEIKKKTGKKIIFLTHNVPYKTKLDIIKRKIEKNKHYGSYQERLLVEKYEPDLVVAGHIHENQGKDYIGKSLILNVGSVHEGKMCVIDFGNDKIKRLRFIK